MFQLLLILGCICIGVGFHGKKSENIYKDVLHKKNIQDNEEEIKEIKERIDLIERLLFQDTGSFKDELEDQIIEYSSKEEIDQPYKDEIPKEIERVHEEVPQNKEQIQINEKYLEQYRKLCEYENQNYTLDQISSLLHMQKGELLLLKNLFKNISE